MTSANQWRGNCLKEPIRIQGKTEQNCKGRGDTREYESRLGLALHLISSEGSESFLDQSQSVVKQISDYFRH